jgi:hypothetical protein
MKAIKTIMENLKNKEFKVVSVTKTEFTLENGDVYPHAFELDEDISVEEFQKLLNQSKQTIINHIENLEADE